MGRPPVDSEEVSVRIQRPLLDALDIWRDAQEDRPGRPEAIRRVLAERFEKRAAKASTRIAGAEAPAVAEKAARARSKAASAADEALKGVEAPAEVKAARRKALVEKPAMVAKARGKRKADA